MEPLKHGASPQPKRSTLLLRVLSALVLMPAAIGIIYAGGYVFLGLLCIASCIAWYEWTKMVENLDASTPTLTRYRWYFTGMAYILIPIICLAWLRHLPDGFPLVMWLFAAIWATDSMAFFAGKTCGGPKLAPDISPNKTWSGLMGGMAGAAIIGYLAGIYTTLGNPVILASTSIGLAIISQMGDLFESSVKRKTGVKDSGSLIPGHGGILDRVDGLMFAAPMMVLFIVISRGGIIW